MNLNRLIHQSEDLVQKYNHHPDQSLLATAKTQPADVKNRNYLNNIKYLYAYESLKEKHLLPTWYIQWATNRKQQLEEYIQKNIEQLVREANFNQEIDEVIHTRIVTVYNRKGDSSEMTFIDQLPLHLRLSIYQHLYRQEKNSKRRCYLRNRQAATLAKLGHLELSQLLSFFNWSLAQEVQGMHFAKSHCLKKTLKGHEHAAKHAQSIDTQIAWELIAYYTRFVIDPMVKYTTENSMSLDLVAHSYGLHDLSLPFKTYLRTNNKVDLHEKLSAQREALGDDKQHHLLIYDAVLTVINLV